MVTYRAEEDLNWDQLSDITASLENHAGPGDRIVMPAGGGPYTVDGRAVIQSDGFVLEGEDPADPALFRCRDGFRGDWVVAIGDNIEFKNFILDHTQDDRTGVNWKLETGDGMLVENVEITGFNPPDNISGIRNQTRFAVTREDGVMTFRNFRSTGGGVVDVYPNRQVPIWGGPQHQGTLEVYDLFVEESGSHAIYASRTNGAIQVERALLVNNDNTNMRITGGHPSKPSYMRDALIIIDIDNAKHLPPGERYQNTRGIKLDSHPSVGGYKAGNSFFENIDIIVRSTPNSAGILKVESNHGGTEFRDVRIHNETGEQVTDFESVESGVPQPHEVVLDNVQVTGGGGNLSTGRDAILRDSCVASGHGIDGRFDVQGLSRSGCTPPSEDDPRRPGEQPTPEPDPTPEPPENTELFEVLIPDSDPSIIRYSFTVDGFVEPGPRGGDGDSITEESDGTFVVDGVTGSGGQDDDWKVSGTLSGWSADIPESDYRLVLDGETVTPADFPLKTTTPKQQAVSAGTGTVMGLAALAWGGYELHRWLESRR